ncbi:MAG: hypothetical protein COV01_02170 [Candidatus Taylorbacteria bacterium CG10_big_fil_rev_8_21_14_0_10_41_48]|uniref:Uncharacterized protein n=1 Tax=Candidatus Taylorbacteria bacterium CG10_big_fil_rev_8_21_14_0_10_41_48 TaxID=1975024 RepID=A0A2M8LCD6_9BACT|nr:MAG: hypothetical protein COV01_02170 [Candidatus Taylorbacteria bacterium CG10_big_fil_rev_8_21_14_0_10_41_48]
MKQAVKSQLSGVTEEQKEQILNMVEKNPAFFEKLAAELQEALKSGMDQQTVVASVMEKHKAELERLMKN